MDKFSIVKTVVDQKRAALVSKARDLARDMADTAKQIEAATEAGDLQRLVWVTRPYNPVLAAQIEAAYETLHFVEGLGAANG